MNRGTTKLTRKATCNPSTCRRSSLSSIGRDTGRIAGHGDRIRRQVTQHTGTTAASGAGAISISRVHIITCDGTAGDCRTGSRRLLFVAVLRICMTGTVAQTCGRDRFANGSQ